MKRLLISLLGMVVLISAQAKDPNSFISSPDGKTIVHVRYKDSLMLFVSYDGREVVQAGPLKMILDQDRVFGEKVKLKDESQTSHSGEIRPVIPHKNARIPDVYNEMELQFKEDFILRVRAYDDGVAYRFESLLEGEIIVHNEEALFTFPREAKAWYPEEERFFSHNERAYLELPVAEIAKDQLASLPSLFSAGGVKILLTESDLEDYPGMWLKGNGTDLEAVFPAYPAKTQLIGDRNEAVTERENFIARTKGSRSFPWRTLVIAPEDGKLIESDLVFKLASENRLEQTDWIKPGKVAWDWWNANNIYGVDFRAGLNTETYKYFIDYASVNGIEYIILDEGWYELGDLFALKEGFDVEELFRYAESRNVGIILWVVWKTLDDQLEEALDQFEAWGAKGIKVDFMQRDDQWMVNYYYKIAEKAAEHKLLVDFHGAYKPAGLRRTFPNVLTREGVKGLENSKWSELVTPDHDLTLPFIRMVAGPMDYTPGAMRNAQKTNYYISYTRPMSQGTRVHQMAMYVVYESPLQMLSDNPSNLKREKECVDFMTNVPVTWDETKVLGGRVGDYVLMARRKGADWYVAAMTDWEERELKLDLSFLPPGTHEMEIFRDGINADRFAEDYAHSLQEIRSDTVLNIKMAPGGGWVARIRLQK